MAEKLILAETTYTLNQGALDVIPAPFVLVEGETYRVVLDSTDYELVCVNKSGIAALFHIVGEYGDATEGSFRIGFVPPEVAAVDGGVLTMQIVSEEQTHTLAIYQIIKEDPDYLIKGSTLTAIANSIRVKTGTTDLIKVSDMATTIGGITGGGSGGSSADVRYVTFMSHDGTVTLGKKAVAVGDDCADPITRGVFAKPTRESDVQYNYTFAGWATTPNGGLDGNALKAVNEDRTLYANYISTLRTYTITYYDSDGTTVLKTETLAYGSTPSYKPEKDGVIFDGWEPALVEVTGDASYTAIWAEKLTFADSTWADIARVAESGEASQHFAVGDSRMIPIAFLNNRTYEVECRIVGFDLDERYDGGGMAGITCAFVPAIGISTYNSTDLYSRSLVCDTSDSHEQLKDVLYPAQHYRKDINTKMFGMLPEALQSVIKTVYKKYIFTDTSNQQTLKTFQETLWVLGGDEATRDYAAATPAARQGLYGDTKTTVAMTTDTVEYLTRDDGYMPPACTVVTKQGRTRNNAGYSTTNSTYFVGVGFCI